jgi:hypothetical protein
MGIPHKHLDFVVTPIADRPEAAVSVELDGQIDGFMVNFTAYLFAGDRGQSAAIDYIGALAPKRVRSHVAAALRSDLAICLDRTAVQRRDVERAFCLAAPEAERA